MKTILMSTTERLAALLASFSAAADRTVACPPADVQARRMPALTAVETWRIPAYRRRQRVSQP